MTEAVLRLAVVLPLLLLALGGVLWAAKRGLIRLPGATVGTPPLRLVQVVALSASTKLAVAEFGGERLLIGVGRDGVRLLSAPSPPAKRRAGRAGVGGYLRSRPSPIDPAPTPTLPALRLRRGGREQQT